MQYVDNEVYHKPQSFIHRWRINTANYTWNEAFWGMYDIIDLTLGISRGSIAHVLVYISLGEINEKEI